MKAAAPWPSDIRLKRKERILEVDFDDGTKFRLPAELLRVESPSAEVQGHGTGQKKTVPGKANVAITTVEPVGNYALRIVFDDGHDTGLYTWETLHRLGTDSDKIWTDYITALEREGLSRE
ncbi:DUF971 domain-containing protein [Parvibaculum sp.]|jgi:DUF971 family protein|uniref:DUF971 domain-containing protein n=1 Tax=Parvibaculum sp. TaxID=2024848 RepID=UPI000C68D79A|nr:DUF971 domain-containing protein [Parvibaculum sp.]MAM95942.1 hypothetical protein [Parvibaculum sp.]HCX66411.1 hypothetical protein [Rhodobiaceae bacterium]|tara:strand:- start:830 stop:1192 length:363 start_codon:yes stop_codon:yes gene_type:complete